MEANSRLQRSSNKGLWPECLVHAAERGQEKQVPHLRWSQVPPLPWRRSGSADIYIYRYRYAYRYIEYTTLYLLGMIVIHELRIPISSSRHSEGRFWTSARWTLRPDSRRRALEGSRTAASPAVAEIAIYAPEKFWAPGKR